MSHAAVREDQQISRAHSAQRTGTSCRPTRYEYYHTLGIMMMMTCGRHFSQMTGYITHSVALAFLLQRGMCMYKSDAQLLRQTAHWSQADKESVE